QMLGAKSRVPDGDRQRLASRAINQLCKFLLRPCLKLRRKEVPGSGKPEKLASCGDQAPEFVRSYSGCQVSIWVYWVYDYQLHLRVSGLWGDTSFGLTCLDQCASGPGRGSFDRLHERLIVQG